MAEWEEKLGAILNDPQAMSRIMSLAQSLNGGRAAAPESLPPAEAGPDATPAAEVLPEAGPEPLSALAGELDPRLMEVGMRALAAYRDPDNHQAALLQALRPFVKPQRYDKVDKAVRIARLSKVIRAALDAFKGGED